MSPRLKKWGGHVPRVPHQIAPMVGKMAVGVFAQSSDGTVSTYDTLLKYKADVCSTATRSKHN